MRTIVFDLDGTLADTSGDMIAAANIALRPFAQGDVLDSILDQSVGLCGGRAMLTLGLARLGIDLDIALLEKCYQEFLILYEQNISTHTSLYPGVVSALETLLNRGCQLGICTNKPEKLADVLLTRLGIRHFFVALVGAGTLPVNKPAPEPYYETILRANGLIKRSLLIGDTDTDHKTARAAGVASVLVTFGSHGTQVADFYPEAVLDDYDMLPDLIETLLPSPALIA